MSTNFWYRKCRWLGTAYIFVKFFEENLKLKLNFKDSFKDSWWILWLNLTKIHAVPSHLYLRYLMNMYYINALLYKIWIGKIIAVLNEFSTPHKDVQVHFYPPVFTLPVFMTTYALISTHHFHASRGEVEFCPPDSRIEFSLTYNLNNVEKYITIWTIRILLDHTYT